MTVAQALHRLGTTVRAGLGDIESARARREDIARQEEGTAYERAQREKIMGLKMPGMELEAETARLGLGELQAEQERLNKPVTLTQLFADKTDKQGQPTLSARGMEQIMWKRDPKEGEPESQKVLKAPMYEAAGKILGAKYATEGPNMGFYVKKDGSRVTQRDIASKFDELEALFLGRTAQGRMIRSMKEKTEEKLRIQEITPEQYQAEMQQIYAYENNPALRITELQNKIKFLSRVKTKESKAAIDRAQKSINKQLDKMFATEKAILMKSAGWGTFDPRTGKPVWIKPGERAGAAGEKELSPSQQIKQKELDNLNILMNPSATKGEREKAAVNLASIRGKDRWSTAVSIAFKADPFLFDELDPKILKRKIDQVYRQVMQAPARVQEEPVGPDVSSRNAVIKSLKDGVFGDPASEEAKKEAERHLDILDAKGM